MINAVHRISQGVIVEAKLAAGNLAMTSKTEEINRNDLNDMGVMSTFNFLNLFYLFSTDSERSTNEIRPLKTAARPLPLEQYSPKLYNQRNWRNQRSRGGQSETLAITGRNHCA